MNIKTVVFLSLSLLLSASLIKAQTNVEKDATSVKTNTFSLSGKWRGVFKIKPDVEIPFNFEISSKNGGPAHLVFLNADEHFEGGVVTQTGDSVLVKLNQFDNEFAFKLKGDSLSGVLRKQDRTGKPMVLVARKGENYRFKTDGKPASGDFSGTYDVTFKSPNGDLEKVVGLFKQQGNKITGTFLRITGDSRYLEGVVDGDQFYLSSFIGSSPSFYKGTFTKEGSINGEIVTARGNVAFNGIKNENAALPDATKLTFLKDGYKTLNFSLPDVNGKKISLTDEKFKNKVVILTITGTWCPNCVDEATFLAPWYKANRKRGVEIVGIHYERQLDSAYVRTALSRFREKFGIEYDQVVGGKPDKQLVAESLPALKNFLSFPTTIIINKKGEVAQIHTGYSGPATGKYYTEFITEFNNEIDGLLKQ
ncbi:TlpA disulfide reductase family protein [Pedobacter frigidisoli]|uniref:peroxiredoxin family protein n=1 Tax=Pedobacter frigidisoli TaxID=2530455 RepID=UPI0029312E66|nr:TlpA disulfide reductase family protein [Pedobacter frigidisoli]